MHDCAGNREVLDLVVKCEKAREGCEWEGEIRSLDQHKSTCLHVPVPCPRECDVGSVLRGDLQSYLRDYCSQRDYECPHCLQMGRYRERVTSHLQDCPMVLTECPNEGCTKTIASSKIPAHVTNDCPFTVLQCRYSEAGCEIELQRKDLDEHENNNRLHLRVAITKIVDLQNQVDKLTMANTLIQNDVRMIAKKQPKALTPKENSVTFKVTDYGKKKYNNTVFESPSFYTSSTGYHMCIKVYANGDGSAKGTHLSVYAIILEGEQDDKLNWPFIGNIMVMLLNQLKDSHYGAEISVTPENGIHPGRGWGYDTFIAHPTLETKVKNTQYLKDDTLYFKVSVKIPDYKPWVECTI